MKLPAFVGLGLVLAASCSSPPQPRVTPPTQVSALPTRTETVPPAETLAPTDTPVPTIASSDTLTQAPPFAPIRWDIYDPDAQHLWNRLFRALYARVTKDGKEYGRDSLDPLLWFETKDLLEGPSYQQAIQVLNEFVSTRGEKLTVDPFKRAMFQRDLWAIFDWLTLHTDDHPDQRQALESRLALIIRRLALTRQQIQSLPDNYKAALSSGAFATRFQSNSPETPFLPTDLFKPDGEWVCIGRKGGPIAMTHVEEFPFLGRSAFLVFYHQPGGREATLNFLHGLHDRFQDLPEGTEVALVRQMMLIDKQGDIIPSPVVESVQIRHLVRPLLQIPYEFDLSRDRLFAGETGGLRAVGSVDKDFFLFHSLPVDFAQSYSEEVEAEKPVTLSMCQNCHVGASTGSILSFSRAGFPLPDATRPVLSQTRPELEAQATILWKQRHNSWQVLQSLWQAMTP